MEHLGNFMLRAIEFARHGMIQGASVPCGSVVVKDGVIVGEGWNHVIASSDPTAHGEIMAIRDACVKLDKFSLEGCEIYTTSQPCPMRLGAVCWAGIDRIYNGFRIEDVEGIGFDNAVFPDRSACLLMCALSHPASRR